MASASYVPLASTQANPLANLSGQGLGGSPIQNNPWLLAGFTRPTIAGQQLQQFGGQQAGLYNLGNQAVAAAAPASAAVQGLGGQLAALGGQVSQQYAGNPAYANQALQTAFDPQNALYQQYAGALTDITQSQEAHSGIAGTPYGAAVTGQTLGQFQNQWQNQQVAREGQGAQTAATLQGQQLAAQGLGGQLINSAGQLDLGGAQNLLAAYGLQGQSMQSALADLVNMFSAQRIDVSSGGGEINPPQGSSAFNFSTGG